MINPGRDRYRCSGISSASTATVHEPVPVRPLTYQSSFTVTAEVGTAKSPSSIGLPSASTTAAPSRSQSERSHPDANGHVPSSR